MAHVRLTDNLKRIIRNNLHARFDKACAALIEKIEKFPIYDEALDYAIPAEQRVLAERLGSLNKDWLPAVTEGRVHLRFETKHGTFSVLIDTKLKGPPPVRFVPRSMDRAYTSIMYPYATAPSFEHILPLAEQYVAIQQDKEKTLRAIGTLLDSCASLKTLLEHWPSALDFVDVATRQQHLAPNPKRGAAAKREVAVVEDDVKAALIKARLLTGT